MRKYYYLLMLLGFLMSAICVQSQTESTLRKGTKQSKEIRRERTKRINPAQVRKTETLSKRKTTAKTPPAKAYQPKKMYGYLVYDDEISDLSLCTFNLNDLSAINIIDLGSEYYPDLVCAAYGNGQYYYYGCSDEGYANFFASVDLKTNKLNIINDYELTDYFIAYDMTYDYSTNTMYAIVSMDEGDSMTLVKVNTEDGTLEHVADLDDYYVALAATYEGVLYAASMDGVIYSLNKEDGTTDYVLETDFYTDYIYNQSMEFDHTDGTLYWYSYSYIDDNEAYDASFLKIDVENGNVETLGMIGNNAEICGLYIPFLRNSLEAPYQVTELILTPEANGENSAVLSWKNPEITLDEEPLEELTKIEVYRNNELVKTFESAEISGIGAVMNYTEKEIAKGLYTYKVIAYNAAGAGVEATVTGFIGHDVPAAVTNLTLTKEDERTAKLTWDAPSKGINGGWIDAASLTYNIIRYPDEKKIAGNYQGNEYIDRNLTALANYHYAVEAVTTDGQGGVAESATELIGQALALPYETSFGIEETNQWTILDINNDDNSWLFDTLLADFFFPDRRDGAYYYGNEKEADDWLISSPITLTESKSYKVYADAQVSAKGTSATLEVTVGKSADISTHKVVATYEISNFMLPETKTASIIGLENGDYFIGVHLKSNSETKLRITRFGVESCIASQVSGKITSEQQPLNGVMVQVKGKEGNIVVKTQSDMDGNYIFPYIEQGEYTLAATLGGYETLEEKFLIDEPKLLTVDLDMTKTTKANMKGFVKDEKENAVSNVSIRLNGTLDYQIDTKVDGTFEFQEVATGKYTLIAYKNSYEQYSTQIDLTEDKTLDDFTLVRKVLAPSEINVTSESNPVISWEEPVEYKTFRYDNDNQVTDYGANGGNRYNVMGSVYRQPAKLTEASWFIINDGYDDHDYVNLFIFDLNKDGEPTNNILYQAEEIKNDNGNWTKYSFEQPIDCPNGFVVALSVEGGYIALGAANASEEYPFLQGTQCGNRDYRSESFYYMEEISTDRPIFMVRAEGIPTGASMQKANAQVKVKKAANNKMYPLYNVYRIKEGEENQTSNWALLTQQPIAAFSFTDETWSNQSQGYYKYAVQAVYSENRLSESTLSEAIGKDVKTNITVNVSTNVNGISAKGTSIKLINDKNIYTGIADANGVVALANVEKGTYQLSAKLKGCNEYIQEMSYTTNAAYTTNVKVSENLINPHTLNITGEKGIYSLSWNEFSIFDDFERHADFTINSPGNIGWNYIDGDGSTTQGFKDGSTGNWYNFGNMFSPMAFIVFNPSTVEPSMDNEFKAHSGNKFLACLAGEVSNDDYLISPELDGSDSFILNFYALSYDGKDQMQIGYSFNGMETEDFVWSFGTTDVNTAKEWKEYSYNIPAGVRYVAIRCISTSPIIFMMDDISIATNKITSQALAEGLGAHEYEIYLDGTKVATQHSICHEFTNVPAGKHIAGVKAVYKSGTSELATTEFEVTGNSLKDLADEQVTIYPNPAKDYLYIAGNAEKVDIYSMNGVLIGSYNTPKQIAINHLEDGIYTARIFTGKETIMKKVIVKK